MQHGFVTELQTGAVLALAIGRKNTEKEKEGTLAPARLFCVLVIDTHFLCCH